VTHRNDPPAGTAQPAATDTWIVAVLLRELHRDAAVSRERIDVDCAHGVLTMQGEVSERLAKERAVAIAQVVRGVRAIVDRITVAARPRPDYELDFVAAAALAGDPVTAGEGIGAHARAGVVHLVGNVDSNATRRIAESDVRGIPGVIEVADDLAVAPGGRSDGRLRSEVLRTMRDDPWLDDARVQIATQNGVVHVSGFVNSAAERARAESDARATTPRDVDVAELRIAVTSDGTWREMPAAPRTDDEIAQAFVDAMTRDPRVRAFKPVVQVRDRVIVITGEALDADAAQAVAEDARNLPGVADSHVEIAIAPAVDEDDRAVLFKARGAIEHDPHLAARHLVVQVFHGRVSLRGSVASEADRRRAIAAVASVPGARGVDDELTVDPPRLARP
jgi:osmotically-inducible protein OsmY